MILPEVSNREDFLLTCSIFDDDTGDPIKLDGCTTAIAGQPFTGSAWIVFNGIQSTTSATVLTIPVFPIIAAGQAALSLFIGANLAYSQGDPVSIKDVNPLNSMNGRVLSYSPSTGALVVQIGMVFDFEIRRGGPRSDAWGCGYNTFPDIGSINDYGPLIQAQLGTGIAIIDIGMVQVIVPVATFQRLRGGTYTVGMVFSDSVSTRQLFAGTVPVIQGAVSRSALAPVVGPLWS